jgi:YHS domain-containing protein
MRRSLIMKSAGSMVVVAATICVFAIGMVRIAEGSATKDDSFVTATSSQTLCPVSGLAINKDFHVDYQGKRVYFCSAKSAAKFKESPDTYMKKLADQGVTLENAPILPEFGGAPAGSDTKDEGSGTKPETHRGSGSKYHGSGTKW